ncbi:MAG: M23 family metallopeptidase [Candidatus Omnitrophica bacterium]|nr:M23 family metallopeptidase [Candidatus Omnitrophota bacterium]
MPSWRGARPFWVGVIAGCGLTLVACELPYVNWRSAVPPLDERPLLIRQDAKGDGHFLSPRSGNRRHRGVDLIGRLGSPVRALRSGTVVQVGFHRGLGTFVELEHRSRLHSVYAHLQEATVEPGMRVRQGAMIGTVGKTGNARHAWISPHLHLEVSKDGAPLDPQVLGLPLADPMTQLANRAPVAESTESAHASPGE